MLNKDYKEMLQLLLEEKVDFIIIGAYAMGVHGYPRATGDIDIFVKPDNENSIRVYNALSRFGAPLDQISIDEFSIKGTVFQIGVIPRRIDIITKIDGLNYKESTEDKVIVNIDGLKLPVISLKKLIINKGSTNREKDKHDLKILKKLVL